ncbi:MAG: type pilus assembly protein PilX [Polaromonas sp.]|nr:type pilus assembly protein PilX [Polaromonas sp.]
MRRQTIKPLAAQKGMALIVVLGMLSVVFVIATISIRLTLLAERSARNDRDRQIAFQAAEAALSDAELDIMGPNSAANKRCGMIEAEKTTLFTEGCGANSGDFTRGLCSNNAPTEATDYKPLYSSINFDLDASDANRRFVNFGEFTGRDTNFIDTSSGGVSAKTPRYIIEAISPYTAMTKTTGPDGRSSTTPAEKPLTAFLITALGYGISDNTRVMLQALIFKPLKTPGC